MTKRILIFAPAVLAIVAAGALFAQNAGLPFHGAGHFSRQAIQTHLDRAAVALNLTDTQKAQAKAIIDPAFDQAQPIIAQVLQNEQATHQLIHNGAPDFDVQAQKLADAQAANVSKLLVLRTKTMAQLYGILTPEQRDKAAQLHSLLRAHMGH